MPEQTPGQPPPLVYTLNEFCAAAGLSKKGYFDLARKGEGPPIIRLGPRKLRVRVAAAEEWLKAREVPSSVRRSI